MSSAVNDSTKDDGPPSGEEHEHSARSRPDAGRAKRVRHALGVGLCVTVLAAGATALSFGPSVAASPRVLLYIGVTYAVLAIVTLIGLWRRGELARRMMPKFGDISVAGLIGVTLHLAAVVVVAFLIGTPREGWIMRVYLHIGDPATTRVAGVAALVALVAACEEIVWRGLVNAKLIEAFGSVRGILSGTLLYALAHVSTVYLLRDVVAGLNPLVLVAAAGCGLVWGVVADQTERLIPSIAAHALFTWSVVVFPLWQL